MSIFGRIAAGAGRAAVELANKYVDEELLQQRQQFMSDLRMKETKALDEYQRSPDRVKSLRDIEAGNSDSKFETEQGQKLRAAKNAELLNAEIDAANKRVKGTTPTAAEAAATVERARSNAGVYSTGPGTQLVRGDGSTVYKNNTPTPSEVQAQLVREGLKGGADKMPEADKLAFNDLAKQAEEIRKEIRAGIDSGALLEAAPEQDGWFGPNDKDKAASGAVKAYQRKLSELREIESRMAAIVGGGRDGESRGASPQRLDPAGIRSSADPSADEGIAAALRDAEARGEKNFDIKVGGQSLSFRDGRPVAAKPGQADAGEKVTKPVRKDLSIMDTLLGETPMERYRRESAPAKPKTLEEMARSGAGRAPLSEDDFAALRRLGG